MIIMAPSGTGSTAFSLSNSGLCARLHTIDMSHRGTGKSYGLITGVGDTIFARGTMGCLELLTAIAKEAKTRGMYKVVACLPADVALRGWQEPFWDAGFNAHGHAFRLDLAPVAPCPSVFGDSQQRYPRIIIRPDGATVKVGSASLVTIADGHCARPLALLEDLLVEPSYRGQGHARALVGELIVLARDSGCRSFVACTRFRNTTAQKLYYSLGMDNVGLEFRVDL